MKAKFITSVNIWLEATQMSHLLPVLSPGGVQALYDGGGVAEDEGEAGGPRDHADHCQPQVCHVLGREPATIDNILMIINYSYSFTFF